MTERKEGKTEVKNRNPWGRKSPTATAVLLPLSRAWREEKQKRGEGGGGEHQFQVVWTQFT